MTEDAALWPEIRDAERAVIYAAESLVDADRTGTVCRDHVTDLADRLDTLTELTSHYLHGRRPSLQEN